MDINLNFADYQNLENSSLFRSLGIDTLSAHFDACTVREIDAETSLIEPGTENRFIYVLLSGALRVYLDGPQMPVHAVLGSGDCVGEMSLIDGQPTALVIADMNCRLLAIPHDTIWAMVDSSHGIARNLLSILSGRLRSNNLTLVATQTRSLEFEQSSSVDMLTGLHNRRWLEMVVPRVISRCDRDGQGVCLLIMDVDALNDINTAYDHALGDAALCLIAARLSEGLRAQDMIARYGGDEFVIMLPRTEIDEAILIAERLRELVASSGGLATASGTHALSVSGGVVAHVAGEELQPLIDRADLALRSAKDNGRDRVEVFL